MCSSFVFSVLYYTCVWFPHVFYWVRWHVRYFLFCLIDTCVEWVISVCLEVEQSSVFVMKVIRRHTSTTTIVKSLIENWWKRTKQECINCWLPLWWYTHTLLLQQTTKNGNTAIIKKNLMHDDTFQTKILLLYNKKKRKKMIDHKKYIWWIFHGFYVR